MKRDNIAVELRGVSKRFGNQLVLNDINLSIREGETLALLGPSGCGKSTLLNIIAGFLSPDAGEVLLGGKVVTHVPSHQRNLGMVFQNYSLFPHLTVFDNVAFGLAVRRRPKAEIRERVMAALKLVRLPDVASRLPAQLSGGQQQRVAVARAIVLNPQVLLTDEPFSNLDAGLRRGMQFELKRIQSDTGVTMVHVTHDQEEGITLADRIVLLALGNIDQLADPQTVYEFPRTVFGAEFMGFANIMRANVVGRSGKNLVIQLEQGSQVHVRTDQTEPPGSSVTVCIREERVQLRPAADMPDPNLATREMESEWSYIAGVIENVMFVGAAYKIFIKCSGGQIITATRPVQQNGSPPPAPGASVQVCLSSSDLRIVKAESVSIRNEGTSTLSADEFPQAVRSTA